MKRFYDITWYSLKERNPFERTVRIQIGKPHGSTAIDAKIALELFCKQFGSLKKNNIVCIKELDENYNQIGEDIIPTGDNGIIPTVRNNI